MSVQPRLAAEGGSPLVKYALLEAACAAAAGERPRGAAAAAAADEPAGPPPDTAAGLADMAADYLVQAAADRAAPAAPALLLLSRCPVRVNESRCLAFICLHHVAAEHACNKLPRNLLPDPALSLLPQSLGPRTLAVLRGAVQAAATGRDADRLRQALSALTAVISDNGVKARRHHPHANKWCFVTCCWFYWVPI